MRKKIPCEFDLSASESEPSGLPSLPLSVSSEKIDTGESLLLAASSPYVLQQLPSSVTPLLELIVRELLEGVCWRMSSIMKDVRGAGAALGVGWRDGARNDESFAGGLLQHNSVGVISPLIGHKSKLSRFT